MPWDVAGPIRVEVQPSLGGPPVPIQASGPESTAPMVVLPASLQVDLSPVLEQLTILQHEVVRLYLTIDDLRSELAARTLGAWLRRAWNWLLARLRG